MRCSNIVLLLAAAVCQAQAPATGTPSPQANSASLQHRFDALERQINGLHWHAKLGDIAQIEEAS